ncbi:RNA polymerase sigma (SigZ) subunit [Gelidibacter algens]|uniref:RNA polymerase sigma (SigZ) subunit n=1 Tax=Gelidibacter algens TaxID=49280 RepID=A0A1A7QZ56_9FLAO|nr:sigma-70 family RNA polymerase sigma factor [Gelidibacter algens]OBX24553.1 RNA polymerase subunit sigma-70 [Gelidibacter algens]RAJ19742.1 RNA polymerase sigma (SigZ) subunit [Gelidibacter algens]
MKTKLVWDAYAEDVKHFIFSKIKDAAVTDDVLQDTFIKIHIKLETLKDAAKLKSWVFSIARHTVMDYFRNQDLKNPVTEDTLASEPIPTEHTREDCLHGIIKSLPKKYRTPLILADIQGLKQAQISEQLQVPLATVKSQIQRGRKLIAQGFVDCCDFKINDSGYLVGELKEREQCKICH